LQQAPQQTLPTHVGIIMDGNGRWAQKRALPRNLGHKQGAAVFQKIARHAEKLGVGYLTVYAFSTENWKRPQQEVEGLLGLLRSYLKDMQRYEEENARLRVIGDISMLAQDIRQNIRLMEEKSADRTGLNLNIALCYGGRSELTNAARRLAQEVREGRMAVEDIDEEALAGRLYTTGQPDVDLIIRTGGERRVSNFLLWQSAYAEFVFSDVLWPDFGPQDFDDAIAEFARRTRRMGGV